MEPLDSERLLPEALAALTSTDDSGLPKVRRLYLSLYQAITTGALPFGYVLPSSRTLAERTPFGRNTVVSVYAQLGAEGLVHSDGRRGTRVIHQITARVPLSRAAWATSQRCARFLTASRTHPALSPGEPDATLFPQKDWRRALNLATSLSGDSLGYRQSSQPALQQALARHLATYRSLVVEPQRIVITAGTRQSLLLAASLFSDPGDEAWIESPGYPGARDAFALQGMTIRACAVDAEGLVPPPDASPPRMIYLTPCFQYPQGMPLSVARREQLLALSSQHGSVLFEDDYDSEFRDDSQPRPALAAASASARVIHAGTFSKLIFPAIRVAWLVVPESHVDAAHGCLRALGGGHTTVAQAAVAELLDGGVVARHLQRARALYGRRRQAMLDALIQSPQLLPANNAGGSLNQIVKLRSAVPLGILERELDARSLGAVPLERYHLGDEQLGRQCHALVVGLGNVDLLSIRNKVDQLDAAVTASLNISAQDTHR